MELIIDNYNTVLIDGDAIAFKACAVHESKRYHIYDELDNELVLYQTMEEVDQYFKDYPVSAHRFEYKKTVKPEHVAMATLDNLMNEIIQNTDCTTYTVFIGSDTPTFRHVLAKYAPYKGQRKSEDRPQHLAMAKHRLKTKYGAITAVGIEADDLLGIEQMEGYMSTIMAHVDKDLDMIPGWHYNLTSKEKYFVDYKGDITLTGKPKKLRGTGMMQFFVQLLQGDVCDNIKKPQKGMGDVAIYNYLTKVKEGTILEIWEHVKKVYDENERDIEEAATLLWIQRKANDSYKDYIK